MIIDNGKRLKCLEPLLDENTRILILGTFPGAVSLSLQMYYGNQNNHFWDFMYRILDKTFPPNQVVERDGYKERHYELLLAHGIGLWDIIKDCNRKGSNDSKITDPCFNFISARIPKTVEIICCNGKKAYDFMKQSGQLELISIPVKILGSTSTLNPINTFKTYNDWDDAIDKKRTRAPY